MVHASRGLCLCFLLCAIAVIGPYVAFAGSWIHDCRHFNDTNGNVIILCGAISMWACIGFFPVLIVIIISLITTKLIYSQSRSVFKVLSSQRAWLYLGVLCLTMILMVVHLAYLIYLGVELNNNEGCSFNSGSTFQQYLNTADCNSLLWLIWVTVIWVVLLLLFQCFILSCLFSLVHGFIETPAEGHTHQKLKDIRTTQASQTQINLAAQNDNEDSLQGIPDEKAILKQKHKNILKNTQLFVVGDRVLVRLSHRTSEACEGTIRYYGNVRGYYSHWTTTMPYVVGVELDEARNPNPDTNSGIFGNVQYFTCKKGYGVFIPPSDVKKLDLITSSRNVFSSTSIPSSPHSSNMNVIPLSIQKGGEGGSKFKGNKKNLIQLRNGNLYNFLKDSLSSQGTIENYDIPLDVILSMMGKGINEINEFKKLYGNHFDNNLRYDYWYVLLGNDWITSNSKIESLGKEDYQDSYWVTDIKKMSERIFKTLNLNEEPIISFGKIPGPPFLKEDLLTHYIPFGIFYSYQNGTNPKDSEDIISTILNFPEKPNEIQHGNKVTFQLKHLSRDSLKNVQDLISYLNDRFYIIDNIGYGWFPLECIYAEVEWNDPYESNFKNHNNNNNSLDQLVNLKIPLFSINVRLPLNAVRDYKNSIEDKTPIQSNIYNQTDMINEIPNNINHNDEILNTEINKNEDGSLYKEEEDDDENKPLKSNNKDTNFDQNRHTQIEIKDDNNNNEFNQERRHDLITNDQ